MAEEQFSISARKLALDVLLAEYKELKTENGGRAQRQSQAFNYFLISIGVTVSALATLGSKYPQASIASNLDSFGLFVRISEWVLAGVPLVTTPLALVFFDDELMIWAAEIYVLTRVNRKVNELLKPLFAADIGDLNLLAGTFAWRSRHLKSVLQIDHARYSTGRWLLFWLPLTASIPAAILIVRSSLLSSSITFHALTGLVVMANIALAILLAHATTAAARVRNRYCELVKAEELTASDKDLFPGARPPAIRNFFVRASKPVRVWVRIRSARLSRTS